VEASEAVWTTTIRPSVTGEPITARCIRGEPREGCRGPRERVDLSLGIAERDRRGQRGTRQLRWRNASLRQTLPPSG
jgi:hypothetical protein